MKYFLSSRGQALLATLLPSATLLVLVGYVLPLIVNPPSWARLVGTALTFAGVLLLVLLSIALSVPLTTADLVTAAQSSLEQDAEAAKEWATLRSERVTFRQMSRWSKIGYVSFVGMGVLFVAAGVADIFGLIPLPLTIPRRGGGATVVPHYVSGIFMIGVGVIAFLTTTTFKFRFVDLIDLAIQRATNVLRGDFKNHPVH